MGRFAIVRKKERWTATWLGQLLKLIFLILVIYIFANNIVGFLGPTKPLNSELLIVEGFVPDYAIEESIRIFNDGNYKLMILTGKKRNKGSHLDHFDNDGAYTAATLDSLGFDMTKVIVIQMDEKINKDRTYYSAKAVKSWMDKKRKNTTSVDLVTISCHARRSRYLFQKAFGEKTDVGIYAVYSPAISKNSWWKNSYGFRQVMQETIAWVYARFFFYPAV